MTKEEEKEKIKQIEGEIMEKLAVVRKRLLGVVLEVVFFARKKIGLKNLGGKKKTKRSKHLKCCDGNLEG